MKNNKGVTLIELLVVVVIIGILAGVLGLSISTIGAASAKKAASQMNIYLSTIRSKCMSRAGAPYALLYIKDDEVLCEYYENDNLIEEDVVTDKRVTVSYSCGSEDPEALGTSSEDGLKISFARSTGALKDPSTNDPFKIIIEGGNSTYTVRIIPQTGNHKTIKG